MIKSCKPPLLACLFLLCSVTVGSAIAHEAKTEAFTAYMSGEGMILMSKLPIFDPEVPGRVIGFSDYQSSIPTGATGKLDLQLTADGGIRYKLDIAHQNLWSNIDGSPGTVGVIHIHLGKKGSYGPVMFELFSARDNGQYPDNGQYSGELTADNLFTRPFTYGPIRPASLAEYGISTMADALKAIRDGNAHVNLHSAKHWPGEIAGNIERVKDKRKRYRK
ncbi:MAG: CHRD domain-containing protein [Gammaproteobacteria bacterium]|nr:CHRD domain-containing protein [Gammaproteobacteria bacterium]